MLENRNTFVNDLEHAHVDYDAESIVSKENSLLIG